MIAFDGFIRLYREGRDDPEIDKSDTSARADEDAERMLPDVERGEPVDRVSITPEQHFTQPPPRFTEASLVKRLEELGIGRPSTYATILSVLQERKYVRLESRRFLPEDRGRLVRFWKASSKGTWPTALPPRWRSGSTTSPADRLEDGAARLLARLFDRRRGDKGLRVKEVLEALDRLLGLHFFRDGVEGKDPRPARAATPAGSGSSSASSAPLSAARTIPNAGTPVH